MGVSFSELRAVCQLPVASGNDVAGLLFGDRCSLPITKLFIDLGLSPSIATVGMLVTGVVGSGLQFAGPTASIVGAALLVLYYLLDCVDGEVARWHRVEHARWGYYEYIFHFVVKPLVFLSLGFALWRASGSALVLVAGVSAAIATLWLKLFFAVPSLVFVGAVLRGSASGERPYRDYLEDAVERAQVTDQLAAQQAAQEAAQPGDPQADPQADPRVAVGADPGNPGAASVPAPEPRDEVFRLRFDRVTLRSLMTNFDVGLGLLLLACVFDFVTEPLDLPGLGAVEGRTLWLLWYGLILPLDFLDYVRTYFGERHFDQSMVRLLARAHGFEVRSEQSAGDEPGS